MRRVLFSFIFLLPELLGAQSFYAIRNQRKYILSAGTGVSTYYGDFVNPGVILKPQFNLNAGIMKFMTPNISVRAELNWFLLSGSDLTASEKGRSLRGLAFHSSCFELSAVGMYNLYANSNRYYRRPNYNIYAFGGIGLLYFNPKGDYNGKSYALEPLHTEGKSYSRLTPVIPYGLGFRLKMGPNTNIAIEGGYRKTFTDYLDDVSDKYIDVNTISDPIAKHFANPNPGNNFTAGKKRGDPSNTDNYFLLNVKFEYYLPYNAGRKNPNGLIIKKRSQYQYNKRGGRRR
jgi:hypothetical protein